MYRYPVVELPDHMVALFLIVWRNSILLSILIAPSVRIVSFSNAWKWKVKVKSKMKSLSRVRPSVTPWTTAFQAPPSMGFSRQEYWSGVPLPSLKLIKKKWSWMMGTWVLSILFSLLLCIFETFNNIKLNRTYLPKLCLKDNVSHLVVSDSLWSHGL